MATIGSGCISYSTLHTAKPVDEGDFEVTVAPEYYGLAQNTDGGAISGNIPSAEVAGRFGVTQNLDIGAKIYPIGAAFDVNWSVVNTSNFVLSVDPYVGIVRLGGDTDSSSSNTDEASLTYGNVLLNVLADVVSTDVADVTVGLKPGFLYVIGSDSNSTVGATGFVVGAMAGVTFHVNDGFAIMPTVDVIAPTANFGDTILYNGAVAFQF